jgi:oligopeptide/dipeptide ABC transporter ATP-binding protein
MGDSSKMLLECRDLAVGFESHLGRFMALDGVNLGLDHGEVLGVVGESGCGKSLTALSIMRLLPDNGFIDRGAVLLSGEDLLLKSEREMQKIRGNRVSMIFQEPMTALNPVYKIGRQLMEPLRLHHGFNKRNARLRALEALADVGLPAPERRMHEYSYQLSGGMRQRVMIAMALCCRPSLLIADEPTTALDVTIQAQILDLMRGLVNKTGTAIIFITHDLGVVAELCDRAVVMYAGRVVEQAPVRELFHRPLHPYTAGLLRSIPPLENTPARLEIIKGVVPNLQHPPTGCRFHPRCPERQSLCRETSPALSDHGREHWIACHLRSGVGS